MASTRPNENYGISVKGASKETIDAIANTLIAILSSGAEQKTLRKALDVFSTAAHLGPVTISGCTISMNTNPEGQDK